MLEAGGNGSEDVSYYHLYKLAAPRHSFTEKLYGYISLNERHSTADINVDSIRDHSIFAGDNAAYRHSLSGMRIGHKSNMVNCERQVCKVHRLFKTAFLNIINRSRSYFYGYQHFVFVKVFKHIHRPFVFIDFIIGHLKKPPAKALAPHLLADFTSSCT